jgi:hypothetical protein
VDAARSRATTRSAQSSTPLRSLSFPGPSAHLPRR